MGVFKWLRRERIAITTTQHNVNPDPVTSEVTTPQTENKVGTIRTDEYKRDLAEFQARRSGGARELLETPVKKTKCGRHSLPVSCTDCTSVSPDKNFNYEKKSVTKYKKNKYHKRARSAHSERIEREYEALPNIQFLFQNQVFMPGNVIPSYFSAPQKCNRESRSRFSSQSPDIELTSKRQIDFKEEEEKDSSPLFYKNNSLPYDAKSFLNARSDDLGCEGSKAAGDVDVSSQSDIVDGPNNYESCEDKLMEVMSELKEFDQWADEQLKIQSLNSSRSEENMNDVTIHGLPVVCYSDLDVSMEKNKEWNPGRWGVVPVQIKKLSGVTLDHIQKKQNIEIDILKKCRHPNIILLMGLHPDIHHNVHLICEHFMDTLFGILHIKGSILTAQKSVDYVSDIASALVFLHMQGYVHTDLDSTKIVVTGHDAAKLADLTSCVKYLGDKKAASRPRNYDIYSPEPQYVNIDASQRPSMLECQPLISQNASETYLTANSVCKDYNQYMASPHFQWQAPEMYQPDLMGKVYPCSKSDVYSLILILWECCNGAIPWENLSYEKLKERYILWNDKINLRNDGTYPGSLLELLQTGLKTNRSERINLQTAAERLLIVKHNLRDLPEIIIPARLVQQKSDFSSKAWGSTSPSDSDLQSPIMQQVQLEAIIHNTDDISTESDKESPIAYDYDLFNSLRKEDKITSEDESEIDNATPTKQQIAYSNDCSTPITKVTAHLKNIGTPGANLHRSDSTEYCSILSPSRNNLSANQTLAERSTAKLSKSFTPKSYKPLLIKVPEFANFDSIKSLRKERNSSNTAPSYNFDIQNYSLPNTPIARSNKLRKNAWLSGELNSAEKGDKETTGTTEKVSRKSPKSVQTLKPSITSEEIESNNAPFKHCDGQTPVMVDVSAFTYPEHKRSSQDQDFYSPEVDSHYQCSERTQTWSYKSTLERTQSVKSKNEEEDVLANVNVKPLVAIHEKWIYEASKKPGRSMSLPEENRTQIPAMKPASHCVGTLQHSYPQLAPKRPNSTKFYRSPSSSSSVSKNGSLSEQYCNARDVIAKCMTFEAKDPPVGKKICQTESTQCCQPKVQMQTESKTDQATDTMGIEAFIKDLIRKEFHHVIQEVADETNADMNNSKNEKLVDEGLTNIMRALKTADDMENRNFKEEVKSFSRIKINGNNKPLLQITFTKNGENSLRVLDNCVNVTIHDNKADRVDQPVEEPEDFHGNSLKRCQGFQAIQEARSTEDLYIDDDLSTHMQENFGGKVKLIPLHGSLHEVLCEKEEDCCLIKIKQENGCDTVYFRCDNSEYDSTDCPDGHHENHPQDTVVFKRSISLVEERIQRIVPKDKQNTSPNRRCNSQKSKDVEKRPIIKVRPKSETFIETVEREKLASSNSTPILTQRNNDHSEAVEVNLDSAMCYHDSSSDESLGCQVENDEFEILEKKIEAAVNTGNHSAFPCNCLEKISEENLSMLNEECNVNNPRFIEQNRNVLNN